jgi:hypothetical protein
MLNPGSVEMDLGADTPNKIILLSPRNRSNLSLILIKG